MRNTNSVRMLVRISFIKTNIQILAVTIDFEIRNLCTYCKFRLLVIFSLHLNCNGYKAVGDRLSSVAVGRVLTI